MASTIDPLVAGFDLSLAGFSFLGPEQFLICPVLPQ
jgi:hypothetical protein